MKQRTKIQINEHDALALEEMLLGIDEAKDPILKAKYANEYDSVLFALDKLGYDTKGYHRTFLCERNVHERNGQKLRDLGYL